MNVTTKVREWLAEILPPEQLLPEVIDRGHCSLSFHQPLYRWNA